MIHKSDFRLDTASLTVSNDDRPYGRCIGQVCGTSYPCTQVSPEDDPQAYKARATKPSKRKRRR